MTGVTLALTTLPVPEHDAGIAFCVGALGLDLPADSDTCGGLFAHANDFTDMIEPKDMAQ